MDEQNEKRISDGRQFADFIWWSLAKRIVLIAGDLYKWDESQWESAQEIFLRNNDYKVLPK